MTLVGETRESNNRCPKTRLRQKNKCADHAGGCKSADVLPPGNRYERAA